MAGKLNALIIERAQRQGLRVLVCDGDGLYLRKQTRDGASWILRYSFGGWERWITLGSYPDMSLGIARIEARQARVQVDKQQDPIALRRAAQAKELARIMADGLSQRLACSLVRDQKQAISSLRRRMIEDMTIRKLAPETQQGDIRTIKDLERSSTDRLTRQASRTCGVFNCIWRRTGRGYPSSITLWLRCGSSSGSPSSDTPLSSTRGSFMSRKDCRWC